MIDKLKIKLINGDLTNVDCSVIFIKHIEESISMPEKAFNTLLQGTLFEKYNEKNDYLLTPVLRRIQKKLWHNLFFRK